ncbi:MAG: ethanolamine utilization protein EutP [Candidatus Accumulibacter sp.]|jgi:ethanolamine utilization protein EutP|nr:ethanolamine utilization protein EutP [Accumulibacter sp.]
MEEGRRFVLLGAIEAGKTTLFNALTGRQGLALKTQAMEYERDAVDTPGEFFSHPCMYRALINTAADADTLVYVHACDDREYRLPPGLLEVNAGKRVVGAITKIDLPGADAGAAERLLRDNGFDGPVFHVSVHRPETIALFKAHLYGLEERRTS